MIEGSCSKGPTVGILRQDVHLRPLVEPPGCGTARLYF